MSYKRLQLLHHVSCFFPCTFTWRCDVSSQDFLWENNMNSFSIGIQRALFLPIFFCSCFVITTQTSVVATASPVSIDIPVLHISSICAHFGSKWGSQCWINTGFSTNSHVHEWGNAVHVQQWNLFASHWGPHIQTWKCADLCYSRQFKIRQYRDRKQ